MYYVLYNNIYHFTDGFPQNPFLSDEPAIKLANGEFIYIDNHEIHNINGPAIKVWNKGYYYYRGDSITESMFERIKSYRQLFNRIIEELQYLSD